VRHDDIFKSREFLEACEEYCEDLVAKTDKSEPETHEFSPEFQQKMSKLLEKPKTNQFRMFNSVGKRVAVIFVVLALTFTTVFGVKALRIPVIEFFNRIYEEFTSLFTIGTNADYDDNFVFDPKEPEYTVDGFEVENRTQRKDMYQLEYSSATGSSYYFKQDILYQDQKIDKQTEYDEVSINGKLGYYYGSERRNTLVWYDSHYSYMIFGDISKEEMIKVAESVK